MATTCEIPFEIVCTSLPGLQWAGRGPVILVCRKSDELVDAAPANLERTVFRPVLRVRKHTDGFRQLPRPFCMRAPSRRRPIKVTLALTDEKARPVFASIRPGRAKWDL